MRKCEVVDVISHSNSNTLSFSLSLSIKKRKNGNIFHTGCCNRDLLLVLLQNKSKNKPKKDFCICSMVRILPAVLIVYLVKFPKYKERERTQILLILLYYFVYNLIPLVCHTADDLFLYSYSC